MFIYIQQTIFYGRSGIDADSYLNAFPSLVKKFQTATRSRMLLKGGLVHT